MTNTSARRHVQANSASVRKTGFLTATVTAITTSLLLGLSGQAAAAGSGHKFTDYARVLRVEPVFRNVTVKEPQRICRPALRHDRPRHHNSNRRDGGHRQNGYSQPRRNTSQQTRRHAHGEVFVAGVIGGAIGRELSRSVNGRPSTGATIAGAVIGSAIASNVVKNNHRDQHNDQRRHQTAFAPMHDNRQRYRQVGQQVAHRNNGHRNSRNSQHCTTTMQTRTERRQDGYNVTYRYRGQRYQTHTQNHPGDRLALTVKVKPQRH